MEFGEGGGLMIVETRGMSGLEDKQGCSFKLAADVVWGGVSKCVQCHTQTTRQHLPPI